MATPRLELSLHHQQRLALTAPAQEVLYGGAAGGGKSHLLRTAAITYATSVPGLNVYLFRRFFPDLVKNHMEGPSSFPMMLAPLVQTGHCDIVQKEVRFWNGSKIFLNHLGREADLPRFQGAEIHVLLMDELTHFTDLMYRYLRGRLRLGALKIPDHLKGHFPRVLCGTNPGGVGHCVRFGDVWTEQGWRDIWTIKQGDKVFSREEDGSIRLRTVTQIHRNKATQLLRYERRGLTMETTAQHRIGVMRGEKFRLTPMSDLPGQAFIARAAKWDSDGIGALTINYLQAGRKPKLNQPMTVSGEQYAALAGWTVTEGCVGKYNNEYRWNIAQSKTAQRTKIAALLTACGFTFQTGQRGFTVSSESWAHHWGFDKCRFKRVPRIIMEKASKKEILSFFHAAIDGDGHWSTEGESGQFYTSSPGLADDMQELALKAGFSTHLSFRERANRLGQAFCLNFKSTDRSELLTGNHRYQVATKVKRAEPARIITGQFDVACIGVEGPHNFFIRQNGSVWISGNSWVKRTFVKAGPYVVRRMAKAEGGMRRVFIPAKTSDNPSLLENDPDYVHRLEGLGDPILVRAMKDGDWNIVAGAVFGATWRDGRHTCKPFRIPRGWKIWRGADDGFAAPAAIYWLTQDPNRKTIYVIREIYKSKMLPEPMAASILAVDTRIIMGDGQPYGEPIRGIMDSSAFADTGQQNSIPRGNVLNKLGCGFKACEKWPGSRVARVRHMHQMLSPNPLDPGRPRLVFFDTCAHAIETIPALPRDPHDIEDVDCCIAGTMISTPAGSRPIETLVIGDLVETPLGPRRVVKAYASGLSRVVTAHGLTGTAAHPVLTEAGMMPLCELTHTHRTISWDQWNRSNSTASLFDGITEKDILPQVEPYLAKALSSFIAKYGSRFTAQSLKAATSTISTATPETMLWGIWSALEKASTTDATCKADWLKVATFASNWPHGGEARRERLFFAKMLKKCVNELPSATWRALIVELILRLPTHSKGSVQTTAQTSLWTPSEASRVQSVEHYSQGKPESAQRKPAELNAAGCCEGRQMVYNLTVESAGLFFANGILVSNTDAEDHPFDAITYGLMWKRPTHQRARLSGL